MAHLTSFGVENFKRFERFSMNNLGQINLLWGDNNVGKTSILEALLFHPDPHIFKHRLLTNLFVFRNFDDITRSYWLYYANSLNVQDGVGSVHFRTKYLTSAEFVDSLTFFKDSHTTWICADFTTRVDNSVIADNPDELFMSNTLTPRMDGTFRFDGSIKFDGKFYPNPEMPLIPFFLGYEHRLTKKYTHHIQRFASLAEQMKEDLRCMIPTITDILVEPNETSPNNPILLIRQKGQDLAMPLGTFGDGAIKLFRILLEIIVHKGERLMIDEIDSGVHVSRFHDFWRTILKAASKHEVQIFATTHNWECLQFFKEVLEEEEMQPLQKKARGIKLTTDKEGSTQAITYTFEQFQHAINHHIDPRAVMRV